MPEPPAGGKLEPKPPPPLAGAVSDGCGKEPPPKEEEPKEEPKEEAVPPPNTAGCPPLPAAVCPKPTPPNAGAGVEEGANAAAAGFRGGLGGVLLVNMRRSTGEDEGDGGVFLEV